MDAYSGAFRHRFAAGFSVLRRTTARGLHARSDEAMLLERFFFFFFLGGGGSSVLQHSLVDTSLCRKINLPHPPAQRSAHLSRSENRYSPLPPAYSFALSVPKSRCGTVQRREIDVYMPMQMHMYGTEIRPPTSILHHDSSTFILTTVLTIDKPVSSKSIGNLS